MTKHTINGNEYIFFNRTYSTSRSWGHKTVLYKNGDEVADAKAVYYNRTWEAYQFQSVMQSAVYNLIAQVEFDAIRQYKYDHNIKRLITAKKELVIAQCKKDNAEIYELLRRL